MINLFKIQALLLLILFISTPLLTHSCKDENGNKVDWFVAIRLNPTKTPRYYSVIDSIRDTRWRLTTEDVLFNQLLNDIKPSLDGVIAWNDKNGNTKKALGASYSHSKGFIVGGKNLSK